MSDNRPLSDEAEKELLRKCWYTHDARWFMSVAQEFGLDAANKLNKRTCRALGEAEMRRFVKALGIAAPTNVQEAVPVIRAAFGFFTPPPFVDLEVRAIDDHSWEGWMKSCFIHDNVVKAGIGGQYVCAAIDRIYGWHDALGLPLAGQPPELRCLKLEGRECRHVLTLQ
jgi:hypothetical protein